MESALIQKLGLNKDGGKAGTEGQGASDFLGKLTPHELRLKDAAESGSFDVRGPLGQAFSREASKDAEVMEAYGKCKTWASKREFRAKWASMKFEK
eukprot:15438003-Alexandrium_andersonii.AAC.1